MAQISSEAAINEMIHLRRVYDTPDGREEIRRLLESFVFSTIDPGDTENLTRRNDALGLLYRLGIIVDKNISEIVDRLMDIDYMIKEE